MTAHSRPETFSDADILEALRRAAAQVEGRSMSVANYDLARRSTGGPSSARVVQRFGSWSRALHAAGLPAATPSRSYTRRWSDEEMVASVRLCIEEGGATPSAAAYGSWARGRHDVPSLATLRATFGTWSSVLALAQAD